MFLVLTSISQASLLSVIASVAVKIAIQMATKLGAEPWKLNLPTKTLMVVGYDTFHDTGMLFIPLLYYALGQ